MTAARAASNGLVYLVRTAADAHKLLVSIEERKRNLGKEERKKKKLRMKETAMAEFKVHCTRRRKFIIAFERRKRLICWKPAGRFVRQAQITGTRQFLMLKRKRQKSADLP